MKNKIQNEKILMDNPNINTEGIINYTKRKANKTKTHKYFNNLTIIPKLKHKKKVDLILELKIRLKKIKPIITI